MQNPPFWEYTSLCATQLCKGTAFVHLVFSVSCQASSAVSTLSLTSLGHPFQGYFLCSTLLGPRLGDWVQRMSYD